MDRLSRIARKMSLALLMVAAAGTGFHVLAAVAAGADADAPQDPITIRQLEPDPRGGRAYELVYRIKAPLAVYWRFKTDFENDFLVTNDYIKAHRVVSRSGAIVITEDRYAKGPDIPYRWQTTVFADLHRLDFVLLNPERCGQKFHYGSIQLEPLQDGTRVTQMAYYDFWGATLWTYSPWKGGLREFLTHTARWEQEMVQRLWQRYDDSAPEKNTDHEKKQENRSH